MITPFDYISHGADAAAYACLALLFFLILVGLALFVHNVPATPANILGAKYVGVVNALLRTSDGVERHLIPVVFRLSDHCYPTSDLLQPLLSQQNNPKEDEKDGNRGRGRKAKKSGRSRGKGK